MDPTPERAAPAELRIVFAVFATLALCAYAYTIRTYGTDDWGRVARIIRILRTGGIEQPLGGTWTTLPFNASKFSAAGGMKWIVEPADVQTYSSSVVGKTETVNFFLSGTSIRGPFSNELRIAVPDGSRIVRRTFGLCLIKDSLSEWGPCTVDARNAGSTLFVYRGFLGTGGNFSESNHATSVSGTITFEIE